MNTALPGIRPRRQALGLTLKALAAAVGCSQQAISFWEQGRKMPTADRLPRLAAALGCSIEELYTEPDTSSGADAPPSAPLSVGFADISPRRGESSPQGEGFCTVNYTEEGEI